MNLFNNPIPNQSSRSARFTRSDVNRLIDSMLHEGEQKIPVMVSALSL